jgi:type II secretory ATPase GspE/PulE/Tfp pilus assembly ATPase PilB-like protein
MITRPEGIILVTGPTGSGKTTTLYSILNHINSDALNVMTLEDPVEYPMTLIRQTSVAEAAKLDFANGIRAMMRQDPDVILVGEIRDRETAEMAFRAAMTGHQVYSTLHTNSAVGAFPRLLDIGILPDILAGNIIGILAQRLVRRLCIQCRRQYTPPADVLRSLNIPELEAAAIPFYKSVGCDQCNHTGYRGRVGIYEIMHVSDKLRRLIAQKGSEAQLRDAAISGGMVSLGEDGLLKVKSGVTTPDELLRVVTEVREARAACPECGASVSPDFAACPSCGHRVGGGCPHCHRPIQSGWKFCPYCAKNTETAAAGKRGSKRLREQRQMRELPAATNVAEFKK